MSCLVIFIGLSYVSSCDCLFLILCCAVAVLCCQFWSFVLWGSLGFVLRCDSLFSCLLIMAPLSLSSPLSFFFSGALSLVWRHFTGCETPKRAKVDVIMFLVCVCDIILLQAWRLFFCWLYDVISLYYAPAANRSPLLSTLPFLPFPVFLVLASSNTKPLPQTPYPKPQTLTPNFNSNPVWGRNSGIYTPRGQWSH